MEVALRCSLADRPGALATLARAIADSGGDIEAVDVVENGGGRALDDLTVVVEEGSLGLLLQRVSALEGVRVVHAAPSRGHPGDAVARLAVGMQSLLDGAMTTEHGVPALVGGLLHAGSAELVGAVDAPRERDGVLVLGFDHRMLVVRRDYRFTDTERARAEAIVRACVEAAKVRSG